MSAFPDAILTDATLAAIARDLRLATAASRTTVRGPLAGSDTTTALLAESLDDGVPSMTTGPVDGIVEAGTYTYLRDTLAVLVQPDCSVGPEPPASLTGFFGVRAQLLGPLVRDGAVIGTVSVHQQGATRHWSEFDVAALESAVSRIRLLWALDL